MDTEKRKLSKSHYNFLSSELKYLNNKQILTESQVQSSLDMYEAHSPYSFTRVILSIASVLIGLGILTFIASNWEDLTAWFKFILVLIFLALSSFASLATEESYPKTSRSLLYLTVLIFGGGIFLIQQIFNLTFQSTAELLIWGLAILPIAIVYKDLVILVASQMLIFSFLVTYDMPIFALILLFGIYFALYHKLNYAHGENFLSSLAFVISALGFLMKLNIVLEVDEHLIFASFFILGLVMVYLKDIKPYAVAVINLVGVLVILVSGIFLTIDSTYYLLKPNDEMIALGFAFFYSLLLLYWLKKGKIYSILLICSVILRYYFDLTLKFASKSLVFIVAGLILGAFGFWFEKQRREGVSKDDY